MDVAVVVANGLLVAVTAAYVLLTRSLTKSSEASALSSAQAAAAAQNAAAHAARAADAAVASVPVAFTATPSVQGPKDAEEYDALVAAAYSAGGNWLRIPLQGRLLVEVVCVGATVYLHGATLTTAFEADTRPPLGELRTRLNTADVELSSLQGHSLPTRLHQNEKFRFAAQDLKVKQGQVAELALAVQYSLDGEKTMQRQVTWRGQHGEDFLYASERARP